MPTPTLSLPYAHLNLRRNPFGELTPEERASVAVVEIAPWLARLSRPRGVVQFVGDSGRGKTTRLLALQRELTGAPLVRVAEDGSADLPSAPVLLVDEAQYLGRREREVLFAGAASLALGTHDDLSTELRAAGREPETLVLRGISEERLEGIVRARLEAARRAPGPLPTVGREALRRLIDTYGDDVRAMENRLYDAIQDMREPGHVEV